MKIIDYIKAIINDSTKIVWCSRLIYNNIQPIECFKYEHQTGSEKFVRCYFQDGYSFCCSFESPNLDFVDELNANLEVYKLVFI